MIILLLCCTARRRSWIRNEKVSPRFEGVAPAVDSSVDGRAREEYVGFFTCFRNRNRKDTPVSLLFAALRVKDGVGWLFFSVQEGDGDVDCKTFPRKFIRLYERHLGCLKLECAT